MAVMRGAFLNAFDLASALHQRFAAARVTFAHVPATVGPLEVLHLLSASPAATLLRSEDGVLNDPTRPWYAPIAPVHASNQFLCSAAVCASVWRRPAWSQAACELEVRLRYEEGAARVEQRIVLRVEESDQARLAGVVYDFQCSTQGYEGDAGHSLRPSEDEVGEMTRVLAAIVGESSSLIA